MRGDTVRDGVAAVLVLCGSGFCLLAALGLLRFPDTVTRLHAAAKAQSAGLLLVLLGAAVRMPARVAPALLVIALFQLVTAPVTAQIVGRVAYRTRSVDRRTLVRDELEERLFPDDTSDAGTPPPDPDDETS
ncbi:monovalent cation/H(+) antiporter subunit G [Streptomyces sp. TRM64462]|uniref:monovalent cation/H(+) antiporter subunit G n=1 Tax=Streptomyces sp. TRM64462 TaxID=2741726 RepID=UPI001586C088|nr:monovalent cation/H(+) antiporter subunit G [Streptomyces sp. TRM64462]